MRTLKTFRRAIGVITVSALMLVACGSDGGDGNTDGAASPDGDAAAGGDEGQTLTVWTYYVSGGQVDALEAQNELFAESHPHVTVEHVQLPFDQLASRLLAGVSTQDGPDIVFDNVVVDFPALASSGALLDLSSYWSNYEDAGQFPDSAVWEQDGGIYNLMSYTNLLAMFVNEDVLAEHGLEPPTNLDEFEDAMATIADGGTATPLAMSGVASPEGAWMFMPMLLGQGIDYCNFEGDEVTAAFERLGTWADNRWIPKETATWDQADAWQAFMSGDYAFGWNGNWNLGDVDNADFQVSTVQHPGGKVFPGGEGIGIGSFSDDPDLAWEYLKTAWLSQEAGLINFSNSGQIPTRGDLSDAPEVQENTLVQPFVTAAGETGEWPQNENSAAMQNAVGRAVSDVISGGADPATAAQKAIDAVAAEIEDGGGSC